MFTRLFFVVGNIGITLAPGPPGNPAGPAGPVGP